LKGRQAGRQAERQAGRKEGQEGWASRKDTKEGYQRRKGGRRRNNKYRWISFLPSFLHVFFSSTFLPLFGLRACVLRRLLLLRPKEGKKVARKEGQ
jgi:hypothetical protein